MYWWGENCFAACFIFIFITFVSISDSVCGGQTPAEESLYCYQCKSIEDPDCKHLFNASMFYKPCPPPTSQQQHYKPFCRKIVQKIHSRGGLEVVVRRCGWIQHPTLDCYTGRNVDRSQKVCQCFTHGCNSAHQLSSTLITLLIHVGAGSIFM